MVLKGGLSREALSGRVVKGSVVKGNVVKGALSKIVLSERSVPGSQCAHHQSYRPSHAEMRRPTPCPLPSTRTHIRCAAGTLEFPSASRWSLLRIDEFCFSVFSGKGYFFSHSCGTGTYQTREYVE